LTSFRSVGIVYENHNPREFDPIMITSCIYCQKPLNEKSRICPHCGGENLRKPINAVLFCPRCYCKLEEHEYRGSVIDVCPQCAGLWLDSDEFAFYTSERDAFADPTISRAYRKKPLDGKNDYLKCLRCDAFMARRNFRKISGVVIDICRDHGVWLDAGELEQIRCFIANGGLHKSHDKEISANSIALAKLAGEITDLNTLFKTLNKWNMKRILLQGL
jgi:Zn-finger nucleic acid-binding protein